jgi:hypothetical protein
MLMYASAIMFIKPILGIAGLLPALYLLLLCTVYNVIVYTARLGAWLGTLQRHDE